MITILGPWIYASRSLRWFCAAAALLLMLLLLLCCDCGCYELVFLQASATAKAAHTKSLLPSSQVERRGDLHKRFGRIDRELCAASGSRAACLYQKVFEVFRVLVDGASHTDVRECVRLLVWSSRPASSLDRFWGLVLRPGHVTHFYCCHFCLFAFGGVP